MQNYEIVSYLENILTKFFHKISFRVSQKQLKLLNMSNFEDIKKFRERKSLTQKQLAEICGVTLRTVQNWEAGKTIPDNIVKLLQSLSDKHETISQSLFGCRGDGETINSPVEQTVRGDGNKFSGSGDITDGVPAALLQQALDEITQMRILLAESVRNTNDLSQRLMNLLEKR